MPLHLTDLQRLFYGGGTTAEIEFLRAAAESGVTAVDLLGQSKGVFAADAQGAVGDGVADDLLPLQAAMDAAEAAGGGVVLATPGAVYAIEGAGGDEAPHGLKARDNVTLVLLGATLKARGNKDLNPGLIQHPDWDFTLGRVDPAGTTVKNFAIVGGTLDCNRDARTRGSVAVRLDGFDGLRLEGVTIQNTSSYGLAFQCRIGEGSSGELPQTNLRMEHCHVVNCGHSYGETDHDGLDAKSAQNWFIANCVFEDCGNAGLNLRGQELYVVHTVTRECVDGFSFQRTSQNPTSITAVDCIAEDNSHAGFLCNGVVVANGHNPAVEEVAVNLINCTSRDNTAGTTIPGLYLGPGENFDLTIEGFRSYGNDLGVDIQASTRVRNPADGVTTNASAVLTSATAHFTAQDVGATVAGTGIPGATTIASVQSATSVTLSANATATATGVALTITRVIWDSFRSASFTKVVARNNLSHGVKTDAGGTDWNNCSFLNNGGSGFNEVAVRANFVNKCINNVVDERNCRSGTDAGNAAADVVAGHIIDSANTITIPRGSPAGRELFRIDGTTTIGTVNGGRQGRRVVLWWNGTAQLTNSSGVKLAGAANWVGSTQDILTLVHQGNAWNEVSRSLN